MDDTKCKHSTQERVIATADGTQWQTLFGKAVSDLCLGVEARDAVPDFSVHLVTLSPVLSATMATW